MVNPYQSPRQEMVIDNNISNQEAMESLRSGQKLVLYGIGLNILSAALLKTHPLLVGILSPIILVMEIIGILRMGEGMQASTLGKIFTILALFIPFANLLVLISINIRATRILRDAGYKVGFFGA